MRSVALAITLASIIMGSASADPLAVRSGTTYTRSFKKFAPKTGDEQVQSQGSAEWHHATATGEVVEKSAHEWGLGIVRDGRKYMFEYRGMSHSVNGVASDPPVARKLYTIDAKTFAFETKCTPAEVAFVTHHIDDLIAVPSGLSWIWSNRVWRGNEDVTLDARDLGVLSRELAREFPGVAVTAARSRLVREVSSQLVFSVVLGLAMPDRRQAIVSGEVVSDGRVLTLELAGTDLAGGTVRLKRNYIYASFPYAAWRR